MKNIILIGFMGSGKTSVAQALEEISHFKCLDTDTLIEQQLHLSISDIFSSYGESFFRGREASVLKSLKNHLNHIISTGGGIVLRKENRELLRLLGMVFWLKASPQIILDRLKNNTSRPLLATPHKGQSIETLLRERESLYAETAHVTIDTDHRTVEEIASQIWQASSF